MPPTRRHSRTATPPIRRPKVAGLRRPGTPSPKHADPADVTAPEVQERPALETEQPPPAEVDEQPVDTEPEAEAERSPGETEPEPDAPAVLDEPSDTEVVAKPVIGAVVFDEKAAEETVAEPDTEEATTDEEPASTVRRRVSTLRRPSGKSKATGTAQPADLAEAEAEAAVRPAARFGPRRDNTFVWAIALGVVAVILVVVAVLLRGEANRRSEGVDVNNQALTDPGNQSEVVRQLRGAVEKSFSYNYTDLDSTAKAVEEGITGKARCQYDALFAEVRKFAPEQKIVLTAQVVQMGVVRLEGERARLLVFLNQRSTRADQNQTVGASSMFAIDADRQGDKWKINNLEMYGDRGPNAKPLPQC